MIISHEHKFLFVKTRKTAGSTIEKILVPILNKERDICTGSYRDNTPAINSPRDVNGHVPLFQMQFNSKNAVNNYYSFTIERNPWDKCVSAFHWHDKIKPHLTKNGFKEYLKTSYALLPCDYELYSIDGKIAVDKVFKYENLEEIIPTLNEKFNLDIDPSLMSSIKMKGGLRKDNHYSDFYDNELKELVAEYFIKEIVEFGYEF